MQRPFGRASRDCEEWQAATEVLMMAAEDRGPLMQARIGMLQALNHGKSPEKTERRKRAKVSAVIQ
jgi:hypothetical protein